MGNFQKIKWLLRVDNACVVLVLAIVLGLALRLYGLSWGIPDISHPTYSYHPDEAAHVLLAKWLVTGQPMSKQFIYGGTLYFSILNVYSFFADRIADVLGGYNLLANTILLGRYIAVAIAIVTMLLVYVCARDLYGKATGALAAVLLAIIPAHIVCSQNIRPDIIAALFPVLVVLLCIRLFQPAKRRTIAPYIGLGLVIGVGIALRFPLAMIFIVPVVTHLMINDPGGALPDRLKSLLDRRIGVLCICVSVGYAIASPYTFIYSRTFIDGLMVQWSYQSKPFADAVDAGPGVYQYGWLILRQALGYPLYILSAIGICQAVVTRARSDVVVLTALLPYFVLVTFTSWVVVRYSLPLLPLLAILAARVLVRAVQNLPRARYPIMLAAGIGVALTVLADYAYLNIAAEKNVRTISAEWVKNNVPRDGSILMVRAYLEDEFFNPVISSVHDKVEFTFVPGTGRGTLVSAREPARIMIPAIASLFRDYRFDYLILHEDMYRNMERLGERHPIADMSTFYKLLQNSRYRIVTVIEKRPEVLGLDFSDWFSSTDYTFVKPQIRLYKHQD